jgi:CRISPR-associated protein Csx17
MHELRLEGCTATPLGSYLKALAVLRLVTEQVEKDARGYWSGETFVLQSSLDEHSLLRFFLEQYAPTPIVAPWNGASGFYPKDNKEGITAIEGTTERRFQKYREAIGKCKAFKEVQEGKSDDEKSRRTTILLRCRAELSDAAVEWLDAAMGVAADGSRSFAPVLGTGGNEGHLDYTNNFMARLASLLIAPDKKLPIRQLLANCVFGQPTKGFQNLSAGQYDPGRAGGANQGPGIAHEKIPGNPWDLILTLEGAVAWASGLYRRQGVSYRSVLCSPFTVHATSVGYGSASEGDEARAELWTPLWSRPVQYAELRVLLREGRASVQARAARNGLEFAEAACSLGVDRGIERFVRYNLLKRRGDSFVAVPTGTFDTRYRSEADLMREMRSFLDRHSWLWPAKDGTRRQIDAAMMNVLAGKDGASPRDVMVALGRRLRRVGMTTEHRLPFQELSARPWLQACDFDKAEVRIAAALASLFTRDVGSMADHLSRGDNRFAWEGTTLPARLLSVLQRRLQIGVAEETEVNPVRGRCEIHPGDATLFIERSVDDDLIEELTFAFVTLKWGEFERMEKGIAAAEVSPIHALLKVLFLPGKVEVNGEGKRLAGDARVLSLLRAGDIGAATQIAVHRLRVAGLRPLQLEYLGGVNAERLAGSLLIPVWVQDLLTAGILHAKEKQAYA